MCYMAHAVVCGYKLSICESVFQILKYLWLSNSILCLSENKNWNCHLSGQCSFPFLNFTRTVLLLGDISSFTSKPRPRLLYSFFICLFARSHCKRVSNFCLLLSLSGSAFPLLKALSGMGLHAHDPPVTSFPVCLNFFPFKCTLSAWIKLAERNTHTCSYRQVSLAGSFLLISQGGIQHWHNFSSYSFSSLHSPLPHDFVLLLLLEWFPKHVLLCDLPTWWCFGIFHKECY